MYNVKLQSLLDNVIGLLIGLQGLAYCQLFEDSSVKTSGSTPCIHRDDFGYFFFNSQYTPGKGIKQSICNDSDVRRHCKYLVIMLLT